MAVGGFNRCGSSSIHIRDACGIATLTCRTKSVLRNPPPRSARRTMAFVPTRLDFTVWVGQRTLDTANAISAHTSSEKRGELGGGAPDAVFKAASRSLPPPVLSSARTVRTSV